jgi:acyl carrier protein
MDSVAIQAKLTPIFRRIFDSPTLVLSDAQNLKDLPNWDSLNQINLIIAIEQEMHVKFKLEDLNRISTTGSIIQIIREQTNS